MTQTDLRGDEPDALRDTIDTSRLAAYLRTVLPEQTAPLEVLQFPGGHSNLTYLARLGSLDLVVKRAPPGAKAKSAHDMGREFTVLSKLHTHYKYAPRAYAYAEDTTILGSPFCVMERLTGVIVRRAYEAETATATIRAHFDGLIDGLADLHALDPAAVGLGDFGRPRGYTERQVTGWIKRLGDAHTDDMADFTDVVAWMQARIPAQSARHAIVHNDFKLDNLVWDAADNTRLKGVLDWEMSTIGDPLLDLACTLSFWVDPGDPAAFKALRAMPTLFPGVASRQAAIARYGSRTGLKMEAFDFYRCFGLFRRAVIEQQKYARFRQGATQDSRFANLNQAVEVLRDMCRVTMSGR